MDQSGLMDSTGKILFVCPACGYRARIPGNYLGMAIRCPGCNGAQTVVKPEKTESTGKTVSITKIATTPVPFTMDEAKKPYSAPTPAPVAHATPPPTAPARAGAIRTPLPGSLEVAVPPAVAADKALPSSGAGQTLAFTCTACAYRARIPISYAGRTILCPSCKAAQLAPTVATPAATGNTATIARVITASPAAGSPVLSERAEKPAVSTPQVELSDKILVSCMACGLRARLPSKYAGQTIKCPKCAKPLTVPLSESVEEATGRTVTIARADLARTPEADAAKAEARKAEAPKPDANAPKPLALPSKRPSGEIAMPLTGGKDEDDDLKLDLGTPAGPPATPATVPVATPSAAATPSADEDHLDLSGRNAQLQPPKRGGVVRRRGGMSSRMATPAAGTAAEDRTATPPPDRSDAISPTDVALKTTEDPESAPSTPPKPTPRPVQADSGIKKPARPVQTTPAPARAATPPPEPVAPARRPPSSSAMPTARHLHWPLLGLLFAAVVGCVLLGWKWNTANQQVADLSDSKQKLEAAKQQLTRDVSEAKQKELDLSNDLDKAKKQSDDEQSRIDTLEKDSATLKTQLQSQQADMQKTIDDLKAKVDELTRRLEAATDSTKPATAAPKR